MSDSGVDGTDYAQRLLGHASEAADASAVRDLAPLQRDWREAAPEMYFMTIETLLERPGWISMEHPLTPTQTIFERNPYYFKVDAAGNQLPYIDGIVSTKVEGSEGANLKIIAGEVDLADELAKISSLPLYRENEGNGYRALGSGVPYNPVVHAFNFAYEDPLWREIAGDLRFRQALNLAINRDEIIDAVYYGFCLAAGMGARRVQPGGSQPTARRGGAGPSATTTAGGSAPTASASRSTWKWRRTSPTRATTSPRSGR